jgi:hypothetical protein
MTVSKWDRWLLPAWIVTSLMWTVWIYPACPMESREDMIAILALIAVPCALSYALLFAIGRALDRALHEAD